MSKSRDVMGHVVGEEEAFSQTQQSSSMGAKINQEQTQVQYGAWGLFLSGMVHLGVGVVSLGRGWLGLSTSWNGLFGGISLLGASLLFWSMYGAFRAKRQHLRVGLVLLGLLTCLSLVLGRWWIVGVDAVAWTLVFLGDNALGRVLERIEEEKPIDPKLECYHHLVPILVRLMASDGNIDPREHRRIKELCEPVDISEYEHDYLVHQAQRDQEFSMGDLVQGYLQAARQVPGLHPEKSLLAAALAVVEADGVITSEEVRPLREISLLLGYSSEQFELLLRQMQKRIEQMDSMRAAHLLGISEEATHTEIEQAYRSLLREFLEADHTKLGQKIEDSHQKRRDVLEQAYMVMLERLPPLADG